MSLEVAHFTDPACPFAFSAEPVRSASTGCRSIRSPTRGRRRRSRPAAPSSPPGSTRLAARRRCCGGCACGRWSVERALQADIDAARSPSPAARALDHKLGGPRSQRRYTAPSYELSNPATGATASVPGFNPIEAYETAMASLAPGLRRRPPPASVDELLAWAGQPLATAEVAAIMQLDHVHARVALGRAARPVPAGADSYWEPR